MGVHRLIARICIPVFLFTLACSAAGPVAGARSFGAASPVSGTEREIQEPVGISPLSPNLPPGWWTDVQQNIRRSEYNVTWQKPTCLPESSILPTMPREGAYHAPNRAQNLRSFFAQEGIRIVPRVSIGKDGVPGWALGLDLVGYGTAEELRVDGNRIEYRRGDSSIREWYVNDEMGVEVNYQVLESRALVDSESGLALDLNLSADLAARQVGESTVEFAVLGGKVVLRYGNLRVEDGVGRRIPASLSLSSTSLVIRLEDSPLAYPVTVRATITGDTDGGSLQSVSASPDWTGEGDQVDARFGVSVATAGDVNGDGFSDVIVGADFYDNGNSEEGAVFVYYGSASGPSATPDWTAEGDQDSAYLGGAVATAGDVNGDGYSDIIVGAREYDNGNTDEGMVRVYHGSGSGPSSTPDWTAEGDSDGAFLGKSVSTAGDVNGDGYSDVIVGAHQYSNGHSQEGRALVYHGSSSGLSTSADWTIESDQASARLGISVCTAGDVNGDGYSDVIVGAHLYDNDQSDEGLASVYHGSSSGLGGTADWTVEGNQDTSRFAFSVATAGDVNGDGYADVIIGAYLYDNPESNEGRVFAYHGSSTGLNTTPDWTAESDANNAHLGYAVFTAGDVNGDGYADVIVGADRYDNGTSNEGMAFVFKGSDTGLRSGIYWSDDGGQADAYFGSAVSTAGDVNGDGYSDIIVGAYNAANGESGEGQSYVYYGAADSLRGTADWTSEVDQDSASYGWSARSAGDVNGDGYADVIVGAYEYDNGQDNEGMVFVYHGSAAGLSTTADWTAEGDQHFAYFGWAVSSAGDVNGDGYDDVIVGAYWYDNGQNNEGGAFVYHGSPTGLSATPDWTAEGDQGNVSYGAEFGYSVGGAGDLNTDGFADVIVGARYYENGETREGQVFVFHGSATGLSTTADWTAEGDQANSSFGHAVGTAGDVNMDGYTDVIITASWYDNSFTDEGRALVYHGSASGLGTTPDWTTEGAQGSAYYGWSAGTAGDVNGDGYADVIVGSHYYDNGQQSEGRAYLYHGSSSGLSASADWSYESDQANAYLGACVGTAGDVNGDGYADVVMGAYGYANSQSDEGAAFVFHGSSSGLGSSADWSVESNQSLAELGRAAASAGDVNGDGYADLIVGAYQYDNGETDEGRTFLFYGNRGQGLTLNPRQRFSDNSGPIARLGWSDQNDSFYLNLLGRTPYGRGDVMLEWEVKPLGTLFDGTGTGMSAAWSDTGTSGVQMNELVSGLTASTAYHWRVRLHYSPDRLPFQPASRWLTMPWNGWQEKDLRTAGPLAVELASLEARPANGGIELFWETISEHDNLGFHIYRSVTYEEQGERLNAELIPSRAPGQGEGAVYAFLDTTAQPGVLYYYTLEDVDAGGARTPHGPVLLTLYRMYLPLVARP
jgi:hypothetical protein